MPFEWNLMQAITALKFFLRQLLCHVLGAQLMSHLSQSVLSVKAMMSQEYFAVVVAAAVRLVAQLPASQVH